MMATSTRRRTRGQRAAAKVAAIEKELKPPPVRAPSERVLRVFAFDPSLATQLDLLEINEAVLRIPWERDLGRGPCGEYLEVIDFDPASDSFYPPVDLSDPDVLAQDGLAPGEGDPRFHQQMVYAVSMQTIVNFERNLGRRVLWSERSVPRGAKNEWDQKFVRRLRIYPHALREPNAYYSPVKKALLFGYFPAVSDDPVNLPGGLVFTCLSHDVVVHETTHAILDGIHPRYALGGNLDMHAFHEAFADIIALFQHFQMPEVLRHQIRRTRGDLAKQNFLGELAVQFGEAIGQRGALRSAIGSIDRATGEWKPHVPSRREYEDNTEPHARGAVLVAAVFEAFLSIYRRRTADLVRIATGGAGILPEGELHPDLVNRLADEAAKAAGHVLRICIRAIDFCPPVDLTFGDFLRALITADLEAESQDKYGYRVAFIDGFRRRGILPLDVRSLSPESLRWEQASIGLPMTGELQKELSPAFKADNTRRQLFMRMKRSQVGVHRAWVQSGAIRTAAHEEQMGLVLTPESQRKLRSVSPGVEVHAVRPAFRVGVNGRERIDLVVELTQARRGYFDEKRQAAADRGEDAGDPDFMFRGGCTLLVDYETGVARYCVRKNVGSATRLPRQAAFESENQPLSSMYGVTAPEHEPFAMMHRGV
jgi:hypothetical protein